MIENEANESTNTQNAYDLVFKDKSRPIRFRLSDIADPVNLMASIAKQHDDIFDELPLRHNVIDRHRIGSRIVHEAMLEHSGNGTGLFFYMKSTCNDLMKINTVCRKKHVYLDYEIRKAGTDETLIRLLIPRWKHLHTERHPEHNCIAWVKWYDSLSLIENDPSLLIDVHDELELFQDGDSLVEIIVPFVETRKNCEVEGWRLNDNLNEDHPFYDWWMA